MSIEVDLRHRMGAFTLDARFTAPSGITALFGRSGAGKSTIVQAIAGLVRPQAGRIVLGGRVLLDTAAGIDIPRHRRRLGYVFQEGRLFPHLSVRQNLVFGRWFAPRGSAGDDVARVVDLLGIAPLLARRPGHLSGGEKQRVAIGRALLSAPDALLMDEPLAALDDARRAEILPYLERLRDEVRVPILYVSHSVAEIARLATTVVAIADGRVERVGGASDVLSDPSAARLMGGGDAGAVLTARVVAHDPADALTELAGGGGRLFVPLLSDPPGAEVRVRLRADDVMIALDRPLGISALNVLPATITQLVEGRGGRVAIGLACGPDRILARITRRSAMALGLAPGTACFAVLKSVAIARHDLGHG